MGVATGLICSYLFRHTRIRDYPKYEISLLFLFAYGAYALAEVLNSPASWRCFSAELVICALQS